MPPISKSQAKLNREWISKYPEGIYTTDNKIIFCQPCNQQVPCSMAGHLRQHNETARHKENAERQSTSKQQFLVDAFSNKEVSDPFAEELCDALVAANIPFNKLKNPSYNNFLSKYCQRNIPDESTLRKNYLKVCYRRTISRIKQELGQCFVWASVDETTDSCVNGQQAEIEMAPNMVAAMKFAPLQSCDVERSFSVYKNILADNRTNFTPENLEIYLICNCEKRD